MTNELEKNNDVKQDEISLKELVLKIKEWWQYLWSKKWIIIASGIIGGLLGIGYAFIQKPIYTATTTFVLEGGEKSGGLAGYAGVASMMGIDLSGGGGGVFQGDNILQLYKSRTMLERTLFSKVDTISGETLVERYLKVRKLREAWSKNNLLANFQFDKMYEDPIKNRVKDSIVGKIVLDISNNFLEVYKPDKKLNIINVDMKFTDEFFAKRFNEELVKNVNDFYIKTKTKRSLENIAILNHKTDSVRRMMNSSINSAVAIVDATPNLNPTRQIQRVAPAQRAQFSAEANKAVLNTLIQNLEMSKIALLKETPLIQVIDGPILPLRISKLGKLTNGVLFAIIFGFIASVFYILKLLISNYHN